jgi:hypothetical protein
MSGSNRRDCRITAVIPRPDRFPSPLGEGEVDDLVRLPCNGDVGDEVKTSSIIDDYLRRTRLPGHVLRSYDAVREGPPASDIGGVPDGRETIRPLVWGR